MGSRAFRRIRVWAGKGPLVSQVHDGAVTYLPPVGGSAYPGSVIPSQSPTMFAGPVAPWLGQPTATRQHAAALLQLSYRWLEGVVPGTPSAAALVPPLVTAVQLYMSRQYDSCLTQIAGVWQIARERGFVVPNLAR
jgi:hypothetical protein